MLRVKQLVEADRVELQLHPVLPTPTILEDNNSGEMIIADTCWVCRTHYLKCSTYLALTILCGN